MRVRVQDPDRPPDDTLVSARQSTLAAIHEAVSIVITSHPKPDGDAVGSSLGLARLLRAVGKTVFVAGLNPIPRCYAGLVQPGEVCTVDEVVGRSNDLLIALDVASKERLPDGFEGWDPDVPIVNIDHHGDNTRFGRINLVDPEASSTGEIIFDLARAGSVPLRRDIAIPLWVAIVTDTGRFSHQNTTPRAMHAAAELLAHDVPTGELDRRIYGTLTRADLELRQRAVQSLEFHEDGNVVFAALRPADFAAAGCGPEEIGELIDIPRSIEGVDVAVLFYEHPTRPGIHVSMRSNGARDVREVCQALGGGGHVLAAGCTVLVDMDAAKEQVLRELQHRRADPPEQEEARS